MYNGFRKNCLCCTFNLKLIKLQYLSIYTQKLIILNCFKSYLSQTLILRVEPLNKFFKDLIWLHPAFPQFSFLFTGALSKDFNFCLVTWRNSPFKSRLTNSNQAMKHTVTPSFLLYAKGLIEYESSCWMFASWVLVDPYVATLPFHFIMGNWM